MKLINLSLYTVRDAEGAVAGWVTASSLGYVGLRRGASDSGTAT